MEYDTTKLDEVVLALLYFNAHTDHGVTVVSNGLASEIPRRRSEAP